MEEASTSTASLPTSTKRPHPDPDTPTAATSTTSISQSSSQNMVTNDETHRVPAFLQQTKTEIHQQFEELEWRQRLRSADANMCPDSSPWAIEQEIEVQQRNRYANVQPYRASRIHLNALPGQSDYINASPIKVKNSKTGEETRYIATQGPKDNQYNHFWQMVWENTGDVAVVVMLTQTVEAGRDKCAQYFPFDQDRDTLVVDDKDPFTDHAPATVKLLEMDYNEKAHSIIRKLELTFEGKSKTVWHMLFTNWPDFGVPEGDEKQGLLELLKLSANKNISPESPRIVHCSAGVGRSGTFIALDHLLRELDSSAFDQVSEGDDMIFDTVNSLREQRMMMVQSEVQYQFLYSVLKEKTGAAKESSGVLPALNTSVDGVSDDPDRRTPKVAKLSVDIDPDVSSSDSEVLSEEAQIIEHVGADVDGV